MYVHVFRIIMSQDSSYNASHLLPVPTAHSHVSKLCRDTGHNIKTLRALSAAHSEVTLKRPEVVIDDFEMANIETQWAFLPVYIYMWRNQQTMCRMYWGAA